MRSAVVTIVAGRHQHLRAQRTSLHMGTTRPDLHVVVALGDPTIETLLAADPADVQLALPTLSLEVPGNPGALPLAAGRNAGAAAALAAGAELLVFLDVDCLAAHDLIERYSRAASERPDAVLCGPVTYLPPTPSTGWITSALAEHRAPHAARPDPPAGQLVEADPALFWSLSFAVTAATWRRIGGFDPGYVGYGAEDTDFARTATAAGVPTLWVGGADAFHQHHPTSSPPLQHVDAVLRNGARYAQRWGVWPMTGWLQEFEHLGLVTRDGSDWRRGAQIRLATVPPAHPYVEAVRPSAVAAFCPERVDDWQPDPLLNPTDLRQARDGIDLVHVHFGYDHLEPAELERWVAELDAVALPLVVTVHDLRNPHHAHPARHDAHLRLLLAAADEVLTLTTAAAQEIAARFGRHAQVLAHPSLLGQESIARTDVDDARPTVLVPLKSLRRNVCAPARVVAAVVDGARASEARICVDVHPEVVDDDALAPIHDLAAEGRIQLTVHPRRSDAGLISRLAGAHALVLPYRFGTHSGWVELARDVGTRVVVPSGGQYLDQWPHAVSYVNDERQGLDADTLRAAVQLALHEPRPAPAERAERIAAREQIRAAHEIVYRRVLRSNAARLAAAGRSR